MSRKFISFEDVRELADIEQLARMLNLPLQQKGVQLRCSCPVHGGDERTLTISPNVTSRHNGSLGVFYCQKAQKGGDRIALVAHVMDFGEDKKAQQDAAFFIADQFGMNSTVETVSSDSTENSRNRADRSTEAEQPAVRVSTSTAPPAPPAPRQGREGAFDNVKFAANLKYDEGTIALEVSEELASLYRIGAHRGKQYVPICPPDVMPLNWAEYDPATGKLRIPTKWLATPNVIRLKRA